MAVTDTYAVLEVSDSAYEEILRLLTEAGTLLVFEDGAIDMSGVVITRKKHGEIPVTRL